MLAEWKKEYSRAYKKYAETAKFERLKISPIVANCILLPVWHYK
jgi:hypothetical protein